MKSSIGERIRILRQIKSLSQENMANELDISVAAYSNIERDVTDITVSRLLLIAEILGVKASDIIDLEPNQIMSDSDRNDYKSKSTRTENSEINELRDMVNKLSKEVASLKPKKNSKLKK